MEIFKKQSLDGAIEAQVHKVKGSNIILALVDVGSSELDHMCFSYGKVAKLHEAEIMAVSWCQGAMNMYERLLDIKGERNE